MNPFDVDSNIHVPLFRVGPHKLPSRYNKKKSCGTYRLDLTIFARIYTFV